MARVRLLRCGSGLPRILIDLRLPPFGSRGADWHVSLAQHVPADQKRSKTLRDIAVPAKLFAAPAQLRDGAVKPTPRLWQESGDLEHCQERGDHHAEGDSRRLDAQRDLDERRAMALSEIGEPAPGSDDGDPCAAFSRGRCRVIDLVGVPRSGNGKDERLRSHTGGNFVGALHQDWHRDGGRSDRTHDLTSGFAGSHSEDDDVLDILPLRKPAKGAGCFGAKDQMLGQREGEFEERRCAGRAALTAIQPSATPKDVRRPGEWFGRSHRCSRQSSESRSARQSRRPRQACPKGTLLS